MAVRIRSLLASGPIMVPLSTGRTVRLSPGEDSGELHDVEVAGNEKVDKLRRQGFIDVASVDEEAGPAAAQGRTSSRKRPDAAE